MNIGDARSINEIARDAERAREDLVGTVEQLRSKFNETAQDVRERIQPEAIKREVGDYVRSRGEELMENTIEAARKNPLQAAAVGLSVAYPLLRIARSVPLPIWMVGAGLYLASSSRGQAITRQAADVAKDTMERTTARFHDIRDEVAKRTENIASDLRDRANVVSSAISEEVQAAASAARGLGARATETLGNAEGSTQTFVSTASEKAQDLAGAAKEAGSKFFNESRDKAADLSQRAGSAVQHGTTKIVDVMKENPMLAAGVGLAVGGALAAFLPASMIEKGVAGQAGQALRDRARDLAAQGLGLAATLAQAAAGGGEEERSSNENKPKAASRRAGRADDVEDDEITTAYELPGDRSR